MDHLISAFDHWYGLLIGSGMLICILLGNYLVKKRGYYADFIFTIAIICLPLAIIGARVYYIVFDIIGGSASYADWFKMDGKFTLLIFIGFTKSGGKWEFDGLSGLAIYGGLIFAVLGGLIARLINRRDKNPTHQITFIQMLDAFFVLIILGQVIGRWGNFANGEAYGNLVTNPKLHWFPFSVYIKFPKNAGEVPGYYQATFFYESFLNFIGFFILLYACYGKRKSFDGFVFSLYCIWYGLVRMFVEGLRGDPLYLGRFRVSQLLSGCLVVFGILIIAIHLIRAKGNGKKPFIFIKESNLDLGYFGYEKTIMHINSLYTKEGVLKSELDGNPDIKGSTADIKKRFSYVNANDIDNNDNVNN